MKKIISILIIISIAFTFCACKKDVETGSTNGNKSEVETTVEVVGQVLVGEESTLTFTLPKEYEDICFASNTVFDNGEFTVDLFAKQEDGINNTLLYQVEFRKKDYKVPENAGKIIENKDFTVIFKNCKDKDTKYTETENKLFDLESDIYKTIKINIIKIKEVITNEVNGDTEVSIIIEGEEQSEYVTKHENSN